MNNLYDLVLINDYFEESAVLLKELLGLKLLDVRFLQLNARLNKRIVVGNETRSKIRRWNKADAAMFDFFNDTFWKRVEAFGRERMKREVARLRQLNSELQDSCMEGSAISNAKIKGKNFIGYNPKNVKIGGFVVKDEMNTNKTCVDLAKTEISWYNYLMKKQFNITV